MTERSEILATFISRHAALLDAIAVAWAKVGAGRFVWRDASGREQFASGKRMRGALCKSVLDGFVCVEGGKAALEPLLDAQAQLLQAMLQSEAQADLLVEELVRTTDHLVALYEVSASARVGRDLDVVMQTAVEQAVQLTHAERGLLVIRESWRGSSVRVFASPDAASFKPDRVDNLLASLADRQDPATANEAEECAAISGGAIEPARRLACAPIAIGSRIDAALCLVNKPVDFISGDVKLIAALADVVAGFLERERSYERELAQIRFQRELEIAADIQSRLMPREVPSVPGVQLAALWRPSREVGGDFYNVQVLPGNRLALALGDITGKGVPAALFMATAHGLLRSGFATTRSPAEAVRQLNAGLAADLVSADRLLTLFAAIFDPATGELRAFNCGHSPILICQGGVVKLWEADGPPIGLLPDLLSIERKRFLKSGDVLVALSDGFSEARDALGRRLGIEPLMDVVWRAAAGEASTIAAALQEQVDVFEQGRPRNDDQTLIVLKVE